MYKFFRKDRQGRRGGGGVALYINEHLDFMELHLRIDKELIKSLQIRAKGIVGERDITVGVCYRLPDEEDQPSTNK